MNRPDESARTRQPVMYVPHGGGPWPFVDMGRFMSARDIQVLRAYFVALPEQLPARPKALLVVSAHWEAAAPTVMTSPHPPIYYDYGGFPPEAYAITWPAQGSPALAERVVQLLGEAGMAAKTDAHRGFDHGTFIPFKLSWPDADLPTIQLSLKAGLDPREHLARRLARSGSRSRRPRRPTGPRCRSLLRRWPKANRDGYLVFYTRLSDLPPGGESAQLWSSCCA
jgi:aromatic ring-opening dioxygenase catalytic subunit (LigB family)